MKFEQTDLAKIKPLYDAFWEYTHWSYSSLGADYSATQLIKPPRIVQLEKRYSEYLAELPLDSDAIKKTTASFVGSAIHSQFEYQLRKHANKNPQDGYSLEYRLWDRICNRKISAKYDCIIVGESITLWDFKNVSIWKRIFGDWDDYIAQLNVYAYMYGLSGAHVDFLKILAFYTDWNKYDALKKDYPDYPWEEITIDEMWKPVRQRKYLEDRINLQIENENLPDDDLLPCTKQEMWEKDAAFAVYIIKKSAPDELPKKARRILKSESEAKDWAEENRGKLKPGEDYKIVKRKASRLRCEEYCSVNMFCNIYQDYVEDLL